VESEQGPVESMVALEEILKATYKNKKILLTGHTGFKGSWLLILLSYVGAKVVGYSLEPEDFSMFAALGLENEIFAHNIGDIRDKHSLQACFDKLQPEMVFHLAAQPLVIRSYFDPILTYETNVMGTLNVLETARYTDSVSTFINVTTDKCYENLEKDYHYKESDPMGGYDMYSSSKACSEILTSSYRRSFLGDGKFALASARAGNVIGGGDWSDNRLMPDIIKSIIADKEVVIRNPNSIRAWQHVLEPIVGYLLLGIKLLESPKKHSCGYNFGPEHAETSKVIDVVNKVVQFIGKKASVKIENSDLHEAQLLQLDISKAKTELGFQPLLTIDEAIDYTASWYMHFYDKKIDMLSFTKAQVEDYIMKSAANI
jgi:CDP-glucose 4,6-dehydratase